VVQLVFIEANPIEAWERVRNYAASVEASGAARASFVAPFFATAVGTNTYVDQIW
jgi:hypothetical protein